MAEAFVNQGDLAAGLQALTRAKDNNPQNYSIYLQSGEILYQQGEFNAALAEYQQAARLSSNALDAIAGLGKTYLAQKNYLQAIINFRNLIEIEPNNPRGYHNLGIALKARNRNSEAIAVLNQAIALYKHEDNDREAENVAILIDEIEAEK